MLGFRHFSSSEHTGYRFGFNGMEKDDEVKGNGNSLDFGARIYDPRIGRWLSTDPLQAKYPSLSPYNISFNNPIQYMDPDGRDPREGNDVLTVNFGRCYIIKIDDDSPTFNVSDRPLASRAANFQDWGLGASFSPLIRAPQVLQQVYDALEHYANAEEVVTGIFSTTENEHLRAWQEAAKSPTGYEYIEINPEDGTSTTRRVIDAGKENGLNVKGYENFVSEKHVYKNGKEVQATFYSLYENKDADGNSFMEIKKMTLNYQYDQEGNYSRSTMDVSTERAIPNQKKPANYDTHQPGDFE